MARRQISAKSADRLKDEVYRQMLRLEAMRPSADRLLGVALLHAWQALDRQPADSKPRQWLRRISPLCLRMIEAQHPPHRRCCPAQDSPDGEEDTNPSEVFSDMHERRFHPSQAHKLDDPERQTWLPPDEILSSLKLQPEWTVADIGAGTGYFTLPIARAVGERGRVFAVDVAPEMLERIRAKLAEAAVHNVLLNEGEASATGISPQSCDCVFLANVWHEFDDRAAVLAETARILKPGGRIAILDWRPDVAPDHGPPLEHRISADAATEALREAGFSADSRPWVGTRSWLVLGSKS